MQSTSIYYFFRRPVIKEIEKARRREYPEDFFYGFTRLSKDFKLMVSDGAETNRLIKLLHTFSNKFITPYFGLSCSFFPIIAQITKLKRSDVLFTTVDSYGVALAFVKSLGLLRDQKLVWNTIGLCDVLIENDSRLIHSFYRYLAESADLFISGASKTECEKLAEILSLPLSRFAFIPFGIDTDYFAPMKAREEDFILAIGADRKRDWHLYKSLALEFPKQRVIVITHPNLISFQMPNNVEILYNLPIVKVKDYLARSKIVVILSRQNYHFAGQSTAFRAMAVGKSVIFTNSYGVFEYGFVSGKECFLVEPGDFKALTQVVNKLLSDKTLRLGVGKLARKKIKKDLSLSQYANKLTRIFKNL